jgi:surfeit locus 1 family protein
MLPRRFADYRFRPRLLTTLLTVAVAGLLIGLGGWQLDRAAQKRALSEARDLALQAPAASINEFRGQWRDLRFRRVAVRGRYLAGRHLLLDNQIVRGRAGYNVLSAFEIDGFEALLLVNRGWVPVGDDRSVLPDIPDRGGDREIGGILDSFPRPGIRLASDVVVSDGWPMLLLELAESELAQTFERPVLPLLLRLDPHADASFEREWVWLERFGPERHLGYAFQWYALALTLVIIYVVVNLRSSAQDDWGRDSGQGGNAKR